MIVLSCGMALATATIVYVVATDCNEVKRSANMRAAKRHVGMIAQSIMNVPGRDGLRMGEDVGGPCGQIVISGELKQPATAEALRAEIAVTKPPVQVMFSVWYNSGVSTVPLDIAPIPAAK